mmetsp:Transcript_15693/g.21881  ORF Transcript_15693/g.21881 Transcript_15693/m.21881 type:complete len:235 (-) Transcript_15693:123-827(-)
MNELVIHPCCFNSDDMVYRTGQEVLQNQGAILCGLSLGNSYYSQSRVTSIMKFFANKASIVFPFIPGRISSHTYKALGASNPETQARNNYSRMLKNTQAAIQEAEGGPCSFQIISWDKDIANHSCYLQSLENVRELYELNQEFRNDVRDMTAKMISKKIEPTEEAIEEGKEYVLKECAFYVVSPEVLGVPAIGFVYHTEWPMLNKLVNGHYGTKPIDNFGFIVVCPQSDIAQPS